MASSSQIQKIHIAKSQTGLSEENYRSVLSGYGVDSSKELNYGQAEDLLNVFKTKFGWSETSKKKAAAGKFIVIKVPKDRPNEFATKKQLQMLASMWVEHSNNRDEKSLNTFICRIGKVNHYSFLQKEDVQKIKEAILNLAVKE